MTHVIRCDYAESIYPKLRKLSCLNFVEASQAAIEGWRVIHGFSDMRLDICPTCWDEIQDSVQRRTTTADAYHGSAFQKKRIQTDTTPIPALALALEQVNKAREGGACIVDRACPLVDRLGIDHCDREHVRQALEQLYQWGEAIESREVDRWLRNSNKLRKQTPPELLKAAVWSLEHGREWAHKHPEDPKAASRWVASTIEYLKRWQELDNGCPVIGL